MEKLIVFTIAVAFACLILYTSPAPNDKLLAANSDIAKVKKTDALEERGHIAVDSPDGATTNKQRVVILAGPHKTGSTALQTCMVQWTIRQPGILDRWIWPMPSKEDMEAANLAPLMDQKRFAPLLAVLRHVNLFQMHGGATKEDTIKVYRDRMTQLWEEGHDIVYGAEAMDFIVDDTKNGTEILEGVLAILPDKPQNLNVEAVITHRTPRVQHLTSVWHEQGARGQNFSSFLMEPSRAGFMFQSNSLGLALKFLERGIPTTIIEMSGVDAKGVGMCEAVACDVLNVTCSSEYKIQSLVGNEEFFSKQVNNKKGKGVMDLSQELLNKIDSIMNEFDCGLKETLLQFAPRILFAHDMFNSCKENPTKRSFQWMKKSVQEAITADKE